MPAAVRRSRRGAVGRQSLDRALRLVEAAGADAALDGPGGEGVELFDPHVRRLIGVRELDPGEVGLHATEDGDDAVLLAHVVLVLGPAPRCGTGHPRQPEQSECQEDAADPGVPLRLTWGISNGLGVGVDRELDTGRQVVRDLRSNRLELAGVAGAVTAEE
jgi:hypothetical protein